MSPISIFAPAKLNLFLAITGRRADGFHELVSVVAQLDFGDTVTAKSASHFSLQCSDPDVPLDDSNLVFKAARAFALTAGWSGGAEFVLEKRIPMGAGLGGGSSDAVATLRALNQLVDESSKLSTPTLTRLASELGSDCTLFLHDRPVVMRGRGEHIAELPFAAASRLRGRRVLVFKPGFGISTAWSYGRMAADAPGSYLPPSDADARVNGWIADERAPAEALLFNNMEAPAFAKFLALPVLCQQLKSDFGLKPQMSGSGSACFALLSDETEVAPIITVIREAWGQTAFVREARLA